MGLRECGFAATLETSFVGCDASSDGLYSLVHTARRQGLGVRIHMDTQARLPMAAHLSTAWSLTGFATSIRGRRTNCAA